MDENTVADRLGQLYLTGARGYSAYEVAVQNGFVGTEEEWLDSLVGPQGEPGTPFNELTPEQKEEIKGDDGDSAYEVAVKNGYIGTEEDFVNNFLTPEGYYNKDTVDTKIDKIKQDENQVKYIFPKSHTNTGDYNIIEVDDKIILIDCFINDDWLEFKGVLDSYEISHIDIFICTHFHRDHIGNFKNLVDNGYIDSETTIYFPTYNVSLWSSDSSYTGQHGYLEAMDVVEQNGFEPIHPTEGMEVVLNEHTKFIFYNTDDEYAYETFTQQNKYNNTSLIVLFKHYDINNIYWGDCYNQPVTWLYNLGLLPENIGIWKMGHHGTDYSQQSAFATLRKLNIKYAIQELGRNYLSTGHSYSNGTSSELQKLGVPVYVCAYNDNNIEIITRMNLINLLVGVDNLTSEKSRYKTINYYVDSVNYNSTKQDGTSEYPFSNLNQCLGNLDKNNGIRYIIHLADGDYNDQFISYDETKDISMLFGMNNTVTIQGNSEDNTKVILHHGFEIENCSRIIIKDLTIDNGGTQNGIQIVDSNVTLSNIIYDVDSDLTESHPIGIRVFNSLLVANDCSLSNCNHGIKAEYSTLVLKDINMDTLVYSGIKLLKCIVQATGCVVTDDSKELIENDDNTIKSDFLNGISLWNGSLVYDENNPDNNVITLNSAFTKFNTIKIIYSSDNTLNKKVVLMPVSASHPYIRIDYLHMNATNLWFSEEQLDFEGTTMTITAARQRGVTLATSTFGNETIPNVTIHEILGM